MNLTSFLAAAAATLALLTGTSTTPQVAQQRCVNIDYYLSYGSSGAEVAKLQQFLGVKMTAYFGPSTMRMLTEWQKANGLIISTKSLGAGAVGPKTRAALRCKLIPNATTSVVTIPVTLPPAATSTAPVLPVQVVPVAPVSTNGGDGGRGGGSVTVHSAPTCLPFTQPKPAAALCAIGSWQLIQDEAGCSVQWDCSDPNAVE